MKETICKKCGCTLIIVARQAAEYCYPCSQSIVKAAEQFVLDHQEDFEYLKTSDSMDIDVGFMALCEAVNPNEKDHEI